MHARCTGPRLFLLSHLSSGWAYHSVCPPTLGITHVAKSFLGPLSLKMKIQCLVNVHGMYLQSSPATLMLPVCGINFELLWLWWKRLNWYGPKENSSGWTLLDELLKLVWIIKLVCVCWGRRYSLEIGPISFSWCLSKYIFIYWSVDLLIEFIEPLERAFYILI